MLMRSLHGIGYNILFPFRSHHFHTRTVLYILYILSYEYEYSLFTDLQYLFIYLFFKFKFTVPGYSILQCGGCTTVSYSINTVPVLFISLYSYLFAEGREVGLEPDLVTTS